MINTTDSGIFHTQTSLGTLKGPQGDFGPGIFHCLTLYWSLTCSVTTRCGKLRIPNALRVWAGQATDDNERDMLSNVLEAVRG